MSNEINEEAVVEEKEEVVEVDKKELRKAKLKKTLKIAGGVGIVILAGLIGLVAIGGSEKSNPSILDYDEPKDSTDDTAETSDDGNNVDE